MFNYHVLELIWLVIIIIIIYIYIYIYIVDLIINNILAELRVKVYIKHAFIFEIVI